MTLATFVELQLANRCRIYMGMDLGCVGSVLNTAYLYT